MIKVAQTLVRRRYGSQLVYRAALAVAGWMVWLGMISYSPPAYGAFIHASGYVGLLSSGLYNPHYNGLDEDLQATEKYFTLDVEVQSGDLLSLHLDLRLWPQAAGSLLGEEAGQLGQEADFYFYNDFVPMVTEAYVEASTRFCLVNAGRRARHVGLGMFWHDAGEPFEAQQTLFEGISCELNSAVQPIGVTIGVDKLREADPAITGDDLSQFFVSMAFDDRERDSGYALKKQVALYYAYVTSHKPHDYGQQKDKYLDVLAGLYYNGLSFETEALIRMGSAEGESWESYGGRPGELSSVGAFALYSTLAYLLPLSVVAEDGTGYTHELFLEYIYSPGDEQGYYKGTNSFLTETKRSNVITALPLNMNFKPALLLFNMRTDAFDVDGIYSGDRIMNAHVIAGGYSFTHDQHGEFQAKLVHALMDKEMPDAVYSYFYHYPLSEENSPDEYYEFPEGVTVPVGFYGRQIGTEVDLSYGYSFTDHLSFSITAGYLFAGQALNVGQDSPANTYGLDLTFLFTL